MFMSSPFRASHRRSRSYSSLSTPSSSPVAHHDHYRFHSNRSPTFIKTQMCGASAADLPLESAAPTFAAQPPAKWDVEAWRRGKRARREQESPAEDADMESCDEPMSGSPVAIPMTPNDTWSFSAPSTPQLPSTSDAFQFFPSKASNVIKSSSLFTAYTPTTDNSHAEGLAQMHSDAFSDLRKTVDEAGEGFVRRMREFEAHRSRAGPSRINTESSNPEVSDHKGVHQKRGRKRPSPSSRQTAQPSAMISFVRAGRADSNENDDESDVEIRSSYASGSDDYPNSPSKKRAVSLGALSDNDVGSPAHPHSLPFPIPLRRRERSSSPSACSISSDDDRDDHVAGAGRVRQRRAPRSCYNVPSPAKSSTPPLSFSFSSASNNSSRVSLSTSRFAPPDSLSSSPTRQSVEVGDITAKPPVSSSRSSKRAEKAVAALSLALANGAGSVSDYEALREAQGVLVMDDSEAGSLWD
ncbi:hypothetical protein DFH11DRAFT_32880 [Phellopilus nigrolimitatus]|nr:hypothetical protein DFH11DRAFT_32880 [Phellopilus nigrolimitatus]